MNTVPYPPETQRIMDLFDADKISPNIKASPMYPTEGDANDIAYTAGGVAGTKAQLVEWKEQGGVMAGGRRTARRTQRHHRRSHKKSKKRARRSRRRL
jgi:hypothetical protein